LAARGRPSGGTIAVGPAASTGTVALLGGAAGLGLLVEAAGIALALLCAAAVVAARADAGGAARACALSRLAHGPRLLGLLVAVVVSLGFFCSVVTAFAC